MKMRWKKIVAILGVVTMVASSGRLMTVRAAEQPTGNVSNEKEETSDSAEEQEASGSSKGEETTGSTEEEEASGSSEGEKESDSTEKEETKESAEEKETENETSEDNTTEESTEAETVIESEAELKEDEILALSENDDKTDTKNGELKPAENLRWSDEIPGKAVFYNPNDENVSCVLHLYKNGNQINSWRGSVEGSGVRSVNTHDDIMESGVYTFRVELFGYGEEPDWDLSDGCVSEVSSEFVYTRPDNVIDIPKNIKCGTDGKVTWDTVENADMYWSYLYYKDDAQNYVHVSGRGWDNTYEDWLDEMGEGYDYYVRVRAVSNNINKYANSGYSDYIPFNNDNVSEEVNEKLNETIGEVTSDNVSNKVQDVKEKFKDNKGKLRVAMQTNQDTQDIMADLEGKYMEKMGLDTDVVSDGIGIDAEKVELLGAALNATESGKVTFNMSKPDEETQKDLITNSRFKNAIVLNLELEGAGIKKGEELAIPVTVTMPAPEGIDINSLAILHYTDDGPETLEVRKNSDGTISFTVTHFSNFVFGENNQSSDGSSSLGSDSRSSSSDDGGSDSSGTVDNSWKPSTPDEIKRYSFYSAEKVNYTADITNAYPVTITNAVQGKLCFNSFEAVLGDYKIGRTYSIFPNKIGKIAYKMPTEAKITLTIPKSLKKADREYKMICVTEKGLPIVLDDIDTNSNTITFSTDSYYAFALIYKDAVSLK